jgi:(S)-2-hydroxyglutarate dehydrogenase
VGNRNDADVIIVGAGIIGLSTALQLQQEKPELRILVIEKESKVGLHQSSHNSGVIHSGIYYKRGSAKLANCLRGYDLLLKFCNTYGIPYQIIGKIIIATKESEVPTLLEMHERGTQNGIKNLKILNSEEICIMEPLCVGILGLHVPNAGIIDYKEVVKKMKVLIENSGAEFSLGCKVLEIKELSDFIEVRTTDGKYFSKILINCSGLYSDKVSNLQDLGVRIIPFRGEYFKFKKNAPRLVNHLIYPVPNVELPFLGVHVTRKIDGEIECGPNAVLALGREAYRRSNFNLHELCDILLWPGFWKLAKRFWRIGASEVLRSSSKRAYIKEIRRLIPSLKSNQIERSSSGVRAQACDMEGRLIDDFVIRTQGRAIHVINAPSPAATASFAIGEQLASAALELLLRC